MNEISKTVLVTGSGTGIGLAVAKKFAKAGYNIIILGRRKEPLIEAAAILNRIISDNRLNSRVTYFPGVDVSDLDGLVTMYNEIKREFGHIDVIVNNAGVSGPVKVFTNSSYKEFKDCVSIHLSGTFWTSIKGLDVLSKSGKIITISTFFTEENKFDQRPYRFRTPYTAAQGAKNRLSECFAWELVQQEIHAIATNPGPVHSDRIYKTVYPKAAAEFLRIGGFAGLTNKQVEEVTSSLLPYLGEDAETIQSQTKEVAKGLVEQDPNLNVDEAQKLLKELLQKIQEIAEKVQSNTKKMIVDNEFLSQDDVAHMVFTLSDERNGKLLNGKVIPNDRVFYPVKPIIERKLSYDPTKTLENKVILITTTATADEQLRDIKELATAIGKLNTKQLIILTDKNEHAELSEKLFEDFHHHNLDLSNEDTVLKVFNTINSRYGRVDTTFHFTGSYDYESDFVSLSADKWNRLVEQFIYIPHLITRESVLSMTSHEALDNPKLFKNSKGNVIIIGPSAPIGKKISGSVRARSEVFRGALRPYVTTVNQELHDVLDSEINMTLILQGNVSGEAPNPDRLRETLIKLGSQEEFRDNLIYYMDE
ncbi:SDR family NAD(P)-dependent oxidoreductase [Candidatus Nitrosocosmicus franklandus]|uniref:Glucose 1-dehydrogenase 1 n=1 Tax=Candidatus Nitrosocosmicus franklandianus TaxID=1798806 RepID=A0A484IGV6_9ARCH|nr:SDR family NAD(P)-dependent oxidoreductase [Candidatus Nitrosocosmicus franklandus]VFJ15440.1 Glucose 1-dehydrogenase 1 [Candidatus Nitrosocosmicus franklandus]